jgi:hypothetical protein
MLSVFTWSTGVEARLLLYCYFVVLERGRGVGVNYILVHAQGEFVTAVMGTRMTFWMRGAIGKYYPRARREMGHGMGIWKFP